MLDSLQSLIENANAGTLVTNAQPVPAQDLSSWDIKLTIRERLMVANAYLSAFIIIMVMFVIPWTWGVCAMFRYAVH